MTLLWASFSTFSYNSFQRARKMRRKRLFFHMDWKIGWQNKNWKLPRFWRWSFFSTEHINEQSALQIVGLHKNPLSTRRVCGVSVLCFWFQSFHGGSETTISEPERMRSVWHFLEMIFLLSCLFEAGNSVVWNIFWRKPNLQQYCREL